MITGDLIIRFCIFGLFSWLYIVSGDISMGSKRGIGAASWPQILIVVIIFISLVLVIQEIYKIIRKSKNKIKIDQGKKDKVLTDQQKRLYIAMLISILFIVFLLKIGFFVSMLIILISFIFLMKFEHIPVALIIGLVSILIITLVFGRVMNVPLPRGVSIFRDISYWLY